MRLPRFTTRRLMAVVAGAAGGVGKIGGLRRRRDLFLQQAARHRKLSDEADLSAYLLPRRHHFGLSEPELEEVKAHERLAAYHAEMRARYERAAARPWLPVPPYPPPPE